jgi:glycosyltransferase involved in cell wall biosynthesis
MRIAVDARSVYQESTLRGVGQSLVGLYRGLARARPAWAFDMCFQTPNGTNPFADLPNVHPRRVDRPGDRFDAWQHLWLPLAARLSGANVLHAHGAIAPRMPLCPMVTTVHDLTPLEFRPDDPAVQAWGRNVARGAYRARRVLVCSEHTRNEVVRVFRVPPRKIEVVRWGPNEAVQRVTDAAVLAEATVRYGLEVDQPFLMHFGMALPRKNTRRVFQAWAALPEKLRAEGRLLVVGLEGTSREEFARAAGELGIEDSVQLHGYAPKEDIPALLSAAAGLCYVPLSEGFGLPILDAFACGAPVVASRVTSIPEVAGEAAILIDPSDTAALSGAMGRLLTDPGAREELRARGCERLKLFSWDTCAAQVADVFESIAR